MLRVRLTCCFDVLRILAERVVGPTRSRQVVEIISISSLSNSKKKLSVARVVYFRKFRS